MNKKTVATTLVYSALLGFIANSYPIIKETPKALFVIVPLFLIINLFAGTLAQKLRNRRLRICHHGTVLLCVFCASIVISLMCQIILAVKLLPDDSSTFLYGLLVCIGVHFLVFWNGILCVYLTSTQLGLKLRLIGGLCGMLLPVNVIVLFFIIRTTAKECAFEAQKDALNRQRKSQQLCATKYPILLVHGVFFRDSKYFNYWGRIPKELELNGARLFYGEQPSAASIADCAEKLKLRIEEIIAETGAEKLNIIAHSKGGLDCRYAISKLGIADRVASLTTVNTPHRGCLFADYLLTVIPAKVKNKVARTYNTTLNKLGEPDADFLTAVNNLTASFCHQLNSELTVPEGIFCQSVGSILPKARGGKFPLNFFHGLVKYFDGENDGLVSENSFAWGENYILLRPTGRRGISHGDMIDLNRENIKGFDVREFYVNLVNDLKNRGL